MTRYLFVALAFLAPVSCRIEPSFCTPGSSTTVAPGHATPPSGVECDQP